MSHIQEIIERRETQADRGNLPNEYQKHVDQLNELEGCLSRVVHSLEGTNHLLNYIVNNLPG